MTVARAMRWYTAAAALLCTLAVGVVLHLEGESALGDADGGAVARRAQAQAAADADRRAEIDADTDLLVAAEAQLRRDAPARAARLARLLVPPQDAASGAGRRT